MPSMRMAAMCLGGAALLATTVAAQERGALRVPDGLAFAEFEGYERWQVISVSLSGDMMAVILGNPAMIEAYRAGSPANGRPFPDGARMAKVHWRARQSPDAPSPTTVPGTLHDVDFMVRDSARFAATGNWGYAQFDWDEAGGRFVPNGTGSGCGFACHTLVENRDYVFTAYPRR